MKPLTIRNWLGTVTTSRDNGSLTVTVTLAGDEENPFEGRGFQDYFEAVRFGKRKLERMRDEANGQ